MTKTRDKLQVATTALLILTALVMAFNSYQVMALKALPTDVTGTVTATSQVQVLAGSSVIPTGVPAVYGQELGISYDGVSAADPRLADQTIGVMAQLDRTIQLDDAQNERFINILYKMGNGMSCEFCCGARSVIFENGKPACGCAHSYAMRGLTKYLITEHGDEFTDEEILSEVGKWKVLFFPAQHEAKTKVLEEQGLGTDYISLTTNQYRGIEQSASGSMVGGC